MSSAPTAPSMILARPFLAFVTFLAFLAACHPRESVTDAAPVIRAMNLGVARMNQYNYDGAVQAFEEALRLDPSLVDARVNLAIALFNRGRRTDLDLDRAQQLLDSVLEQQPDHLPSVRWILLRRILPGRS